MTDDTDDLLDATDARDVETTIAEAVAEVKLWSKEKLENTRLAFSEGEAVRKVREWTLKLVPSEQGHGYYQRSFDGPSIGNKNGEGFDPTSVVEKSAFTELERELAVAKAQHVTYEQMLTDEVEEIASLKAELSAYKEASSAHDKSRAKLIWENGRLRIALEFYAKELNWTCAYRSDLDEYVPANSEGSSEIEYDKGNIARKALKEGK